MQFWRGILLFVPFRPFLRRGDFEMKPVTEDVKRWKLMGMGALGMMGIAGIALGVSFADALKRIAGLLMGR
ncbi:hypothetical protein LCM4573_00010 [Rhizobium sp. LCM 4573]|nr:hypothetical protein LCM4573_00010 [Rhizobium sp. LCM 4573]